MKPVLQFLLLFALIVAPATAQTFPKLTGRVVDQADILRPEQELDISSKSEALEAQTGRQFVVATVKSLEGYPIEDYAYRLGREWKIGDKDKDDGVLLLVAPNDRKVWVATGYGAGAFLTDAISGVIVREKILPEFKKNPPDYGVGITAGADAIIKQMSLPPEEAQANIAKAQQQKARASGGIGQFIPVIVIMIIFFSIIGSLSRRSRARRYRSQRGGISPWVVLWGLNELSRGSRGGNWGGGGFGGGGGWGGGGGGFSGGGGSFGGGGAGGSW
ncbi:TPM domain-containing protein [Sphingomonas sp. SM33]|uniref:TPM domain-containing protein n=1 Tax=Sphingomonas telluris TaxID=2907998 RepID=A0ABS9VMS9_9SPHN|nr:TPM domain-containing protein [Sphingomonas telluris]